MKSNNRECMENQTKDKDSKRQREHSTVLRILNALARLYSDRTRNGNSLSLALELVIRFVGLHYICRDM